MGLMESSFSQSEVARTIIDWWPSVRDDRDALPWRATRDPWLTLMAEFMLSQTQVSRVALRYPELAKRFPDPLSCARARQSEVIAMWVGLGYNRRAVSLRESAVVICDRHNGEVPSTLESLLELPGVGPYTARAVLAFAFDRPVGVVDTNIKRVLSRAVVGSRLDVRNAQACADALVREEGSREWNLAIMDFGSVVCRARSPRCAACPLSGSHCQWQMQMAARGSEVPDPARPDGARGGGSASFVGSDREGRGRLVRAACQGTISLADLARVAGWPDDPDRARRVVDKLVREGVFERASSGNYQLA